MIRSRLQLVLERKGLTAYALAKEARVAPPIVYRLTDPAMPGGMPARQTLDRLCAALGVQVGELLEWAPGEMEAREPAQRRPRGRPPKVEAHDGPKSAAGHRKRRAIPVEKRR